jgi:hypothetical protein
MMMANPYLPPEIPPDADLPEAPRVAPIERTPGFWLSIAIAIAVVIGLGYYYYGHTTMAPSTRAADAVATPPEPR